MQQVIQALKKEIDVNQLSQEAAQILEILDQVEARTAEIRKKIMSELRSGEAPAVHIKLDSI
jgi:hypothetical protein